MRQAKLLGYLAIGGWKVAHMALPEGARYHTLFTGQRTRESIGYVCVWIKGCIQGRNLTTGEALPTRQPWMVSSDLPPLSMGRGEFVAVEGSEWLCFDGKLNNGGVAELQVVDVHSAQPLDDYTEYQLAPGVVLLVKNRGA